MIFNTEVFFCLNIFDAVITEKSPKLGSLAPENPSGMKRDIFEVKVEIKVKIVSEGYIRIEITTRTLYGLLHGFNDLSPSWKETPNLYI